MAFLQGKSSSPRYEIWLENYYKTINIESNTLAEMIQKQVIPSVYTYVEKLADTAAAKKSVVADNFCSK